MIHPNLLRVGRTSPSSVLVVDDEPAQRRLVHEILSDSKYRVTEVGNGQDALSLLRDEAFDVLILDVRMPGLDGKEVCRSLRGEMGEMMLPIIVVTGYGGPDDLASSFNAGATDFLRKPYTPSELVARVDAAVAHKRLMDQYDNAETMLFALARMVESKDSGTGDHCARLAHNAIVLGHALNLDSNQLMALRRAGVLHDIGKLGIPDRILLKPGALTEDEWRVMRRHPEIGAQLCSGLRSMRLTVPIIRYHHERYDGSGYPEGLKGENIPLLARVFQVVDIYDALSHARPYKPSIPHDEVIRIMEQEVESGWRDPGVVEVFIDILKKDPGSLNLVDGSDDLGAQLFQNLITAGLEKY